MNSDIKRYGDGLLNFSTATGLMIDRLECLKSPNGDVQYQLYLKNNKIYKFRLKDIMSKTGFQRTIVEITNYIPNIPSGPGSKSIWYNLIGDMIKDAVMINHDA